MFQAALAAALAAAFAAVEALVALSDFPRYPLTSGPSPIHPLERLTAHLGADVRLVDEGFGIGVKSSWEGALEDVRAAGGRPYAIPAGASDHRLGGLGFANWAYEVQRQERELGVFFDTIIVCSVTGSTQAGMIAGFAGQEARRQVIGTDASARLGETRALFS